MENVRRGPNFRTKRVLEKYYKTICKREDNMTFSNYVREKTTKNLSDLNNKELYIQLLNYVKEEAEKKDRKPEKRARAEGEHI